MCSGMMTWSMIFGAVAMASVSQAALIVSSSTTAPMENVVAQGARDNGATTVRWRSTGSDTDMGATFLNPAVSRTLKTITVQVSSQDLGSEVGNMPIIIDLFTFTPGDNTFSALWRLEGTLPATVNAFDFLTFDVSSQNQELAAGASFGFLIGANVEDSTGTAKRFRIYTENAASVDNTFEIRRDFEFGSTRPANTVLPGTLNTGRELYFFVTAEVIPEPASLSLLGLAGVAMMGLRRR